MTKIIVNTDCGNSPKRVFLKQFNIAFANANIDFLTNSVTDNISWNIIGDRIIIGMEDFRKELEQMKAVKSSELIIAKIITHGKDGAVSGTITIKNGKSYAFSDFYEFSSAKGDKIKSIISFVIEI